MPWIFPIVDQLPMHSECNVLTMIDHVDTHWKMTTKKHVNSERILMNTKIFCYFLCVIEHLKHETAMNYLQLCLIYSKTFDFKHAINHVYCPKGAAIITSKFWYWFEIPCFPGAPL